MKSDIVKKTRRQIILILFLSILCLFLISFIPWITVAEKDRLNEDLHFSYEMMKGSDNAQIKDLAGKLSRINILFWAITVVALISFIFIICYALLKSSLFGPLMMIISGCVTFVLSILIVYFQIIFLRSINDIDTLSTSMMHSHFAYAYILFIISIILLIYSATSTITISTYSIKQLRSIPIQKKKKIKKIDEKKIPKKLGKKEIEISTKEPVTNEVSLASNMAAKLSEMEQWLAKNAQDIDKQTVDEKLLKLDLDKEKPIKLSSNEKTFDVEEERPEKYDQSKETIIQEDKSSMETFPPEKPKEKSEETDEGRLLQPFEKALSSAIKKKQSKRVLQELEEKDEKQEKTVESETKEIEELKPEPMFQTEKIFLEKEGDTIKKIFSVRCPQCNHIFSFDKEGDTQKITCPKCGKEGTAKKEF